MAMVDGLYDVPQTDDMSEAAMAAFVARLRLSQPKPEAIPTGAGVDAQLALFASSWVALVGSALGDRATLPILKWDAALDWNARRFVFEWFNARGRDRQAGADKSIDALGVAAQEYLARLRPSGDASGKTENPRYVDSKSNAPQDAGLFGRSATSDGWVGGCCS